MVVGEERMRGAERRGEGSMKRLGALGLWW